MEEPHETTKTLAEQAAELQKLVVDAQELLDRVAYGLAELRKRLQEGNLPD